MIMCALLLVSQLQSTLSDGLVLLSPVLLIMTLIVYFFQYRAMAEQVALARESTGVQTLITIIGLLQEEEVREARWWVMEKLPGKPLAEWGEDDRRRASRACSRFDLVGVVAQMSVFPSHIVVERWAPAIVRVYDITKEFRQEMKVKNESEYWSGFDWLYSQAASRWRGGRGVSEL